LRFEGEIRMIKYGEGTVVYQPVVILDSPTKEIVFGKKCSIGQFSFIAARKLIVEDNVEICPYSTIHGGGDVYIGRGVGVGWGVRIIPATTTKETKYSADTMSSESPDNVEIIRGSITIEEGVWLAANAMICISRKRPNITIGKFARIGAMSYIDKDVPPYAIVRPVQNLNITIPAKEE
jgi:acetyltransferase-like isoleucine patch superfamily enzyme